ncbi:MAG: iron chelate uptake ABC transporter family permease subunit, partial [Propionibacteriaceae bacterium]|nr:iron chelate uptake ABC transporter family permease subunit [Propionibacteriaceae bacterium]
MPAPGDPVTVTTQPTAAAVPVDAGTRRRIAVAAAAAGVLGLLVLASLFIGSGDIPAAEVWRALAEDSGSSTDLIVRQYRVPRTLLAVVVGAALGLAGAVIQAITRNPLADPGILGVNAGAYTAVVLAAAGLGPAL